MSDLPFVTEKGGAGKEGWKAFKDKPLLKNYYDLCSDNNAGRRCYTLNLVESHNNHAYTHNIYMTRSKTLHQLNVPRGKKLRSVVAH